MAKVYVAGPMRGYEELNFPAFNTKADELRAAGNTVVNPVEINPDPNADFLDCMKADIRELIECDTIYMLKGWRSSKGASLEFQIAWALEFDVMYEDNNERIDYSRIEGSARPA